MSRRGQSQPKLIDRRVLEEWAAAGSTDLHQRAQEEARRILATHAPEPLPDAVAREIRGIVDAADHEAASTMNRRRQRAPRSLATPCRAR